MRVLNIAEVHELSIQRLGLDSSAIDFSSVEGLAALILTTASFCCPCSPSFLTRAVFTLVAPILPSDDLQERVTDSIEGSIAYGDLIEIGVLSDGENSTGRLLNIATPAIVNISKDRIMLVGTIPKGRQILPPHIASLVEHRGFSRTVSAESIASIISELLGKGFVLIPSDEWSRAPKTSTATELVAKYDRDLVLDAYVGQLEGLRLLTQGPTPKYYKSRWVEAKAHTGRYVARRFRRFGADLWCVVRLHNGVAKALIDLPLGGVTSRGCDEAWHLQQALDALEGTSQEFLIRSAHEQNDVIFDFYFPLPQWATRRWDIVGERVEHSGSLISYRFPASLEETEAQFAEKKMWLKRQ